MRTLARFALGAVTSVWVCGGAAAQFEPGKPLTRTHTAAPETPAPAAASDVEVAVRVVAYSVQGSPQYRPERAAAPVTARNDGMSGGQSVEWKEGWLPLKSGQTLAEGAEIRTSLNDQVVLRIGDTQEFTIDGLTKIAVKQAVRRAGKASTQVQLKYGDLRADVDSTRIANDVRIVAPDVTLAVTGTSFFIHSRPGFPTVAGGMKGNTGKFKATYANAKSTTITGEQQTDSKTPNPAERLSDATFVDTTNDRAREADEKALAKRSVGGGDAAIVSIGVLPSTAAGGTSPPKESQLKADPGVPNGTGNR